MKILKYLFIGVFVVVSASSLSAQEELEGIPESPQEAEQQNVEGEIFQVVETPPVFPGCEDVEDKSMCMNMKMMKFIAKNTVYPKEARNEKQQDRVYVSFVINKEGLVEDVKVVRGKYELLNNESVRVISMLPKMTPAEQNNKPVRMQYTIPINYSLE